MTPSEILKTAFPKLTDDVRDGIAIRLPSPDKQFVVETDERIHAARAVLLQIEAEKLYPTLVSGQAHNAAQPNNSGYERELWAVVKACDPFRFYLLGSAFIHRTYHSALSPILNSALSSTI